MKTDAHLSRRNVVTMALARSRLARICCAKVYYYLSFAMRTLFFIHVLELKELLGGAG